MDNKTPPGDRIAKVIARAGRASRREAERMIEEGRVTVNGETVTSPALNVTDTDRITVDDTPLEAADEARLWMYHKPTGLVTTTKDEQGRRTIFDDLPEDLPRVMSVGRLDLNSEGLLLLTNDGGVKRKLELPSTGWLRRYRVRVNGRPTDADLQPLREGITVDGQSFQPMIVSLDRQQGANAWLTVGLREGKNREIRRAMLDIGLNVNRLIRVSYGPFQLGQLKEGEVQEIRRKILRDQLGMPDTPEPEAPSKPRVTRNRKPRPDAPVAQEARSTKPAGRRGPPVRRGVVRDDSLPENARGASGKPYGKGAGKPGDRPTGAGKSFGKPGDRPAGAGKSFGKPNKPGGKPFNKGPKPGGKGPSRGAGKGRSSGN
ncbi:23S rRNA pseudouridine2605 synthase [Sagittula marina]|uniref:Pseudouridine synthase n=1 Tax=Sagittula marina TaxID=943940 RepID=A0A7W6DT35_9RHOB|nr:pseudouridine synthase [Sagittula marina]MBB3986427.1 23S rRNA pseudouridine2605 synthase [Sagittula marina]